MNIHSATQRKVLGCNRAMQFRQTVLYSRSPFSCSARSFSSLPFQTWLKGGLKIKAREALGGYNYKTMQQPQNSLFGSGQRRSLFIQTELTPNVNSIKFKPGKPLASSEGPLVADGGNATATYEFLSRRDAMKSPLATTLFAIDGVESVMFGHDFITITKAADSNWQLMKPDIYGAIMDFFSSKTPLFHESEKDTTITEEDSEVVAMIKELLDTRIRPTIQDDGGDVEYIGFENGVVRLKLRGACRTCDSSSVTLKNGIEKMLMHYVPEVEEVVQVLEEHEEISKSEFEKLEKQLRKGEEN